MAESSETSRAAAAETSQKEWLRPTGPSVVSDGVAFKDPRDVKVSHKGYTCILCVYIYISIYLGFRVTFIHIYRRIHVYTIYIYI